MVNEAATKLGSVDILRPRRGRAARYRHLGKPDLWNSGRLVAFADALRANWDDTQKHTEGRPDADAEAVSISMMHSAKGFEWPIVIPDQFADRA